MTGEGESGLVKADQHGGFFELASSREGEDSEEGGEVIALKVSPPSGGLAGLHFKSERERLASLLPADVDWSKVSEAFGDGMEKWVSLCAAPEGYRQPALLFAGASRDEMSAYALLIPAPDDAGGPGVEAIRKELEARGITAGILEETIETVALHGEPRTPYVVAKGREPVNGEDARIEMLVGTVARGVGPQVLEDGRVDYKRVIEIESVTPGQALARKTPATEGTDGFTVTGKKLEAKPGKDVELKCGKGTRKSDEDPLVALSDTSGETSFHVGVVTVHEVYEVDGNVDYSVGSLQFAGTIRIKGNVDAGFSVEAEGDIKVDGTVDAAELVAGGDVSIKGGVAGHDTAAVKAGGSVTASYLNNANVYAGGNVVVEGEIINSDIHSGGEVSVVGKKGSIVGGQIVAEKGVQAWSIGSENFAPTRLEVGQRREALEELNQSKAPLAEETKKLAEVQKGLVYLAKLEAAGPLEERMAKTKIGLEAAERQLSESTRNRESRLDDLRKVLASRSEARVSARGTIHPGTFITFSVGKLRVKSELERVTVYEKDGEVVHGPLFK